MFSVPDIAVIGVLALMLFGPDKLPGVLRQAGKVMRDIQNTSQSFVAEMERAADMNAAAAPLAAPLAAPPPAVDAKVPPPAEEPVEPAPGDKRPT